MRPELISGICAQFWMKNMKFRVDIIKRQKNIGLIAKDTFPINRAEFRATQLAP